ncbi:MAG: site-2 protease family protein [Phycisphaerae bacterium]|nr:site-2 protease family protein [Phycisphaerae bacterium]
MAGHRLFPDLQSRKETPTEDFNSNVLALALNSTALVIRAPVVILALTLHEFMHGYVAWRCGDPTARNMGRLTLNPLHHLDPIGTICLFLGPIGWAKPVIVNPLNFRRPSRDDMLVSFAGPGINFAIAIGLCLVMRLLVAMDYWPAEESLGFILCQFLSVGAILNFALGLFNLIPLGPLDGHHILRELLPPRARDKYLAFNRYGMFIILALIMLPRLVRGTPNILWEILGPPLVLLLRIFAGDGGAYRIEVWYDSVGWLIRG